MITANLNHAVVAQMWAPDSAASRYRAHQLEQQAAEATLAAPAVTIALLVSGGAK